MPVQQYSNLFKTFDLGSAVRSGQQIETNRLKNEAVGMDNAVRQNTIKNRQKAQEIRKMYDTMPDQIAALEEASMFQQADELRNNYIAVRKNEVDLLSGMRDSINADNYKNLRQDLLKAGAVTPDMMPVEYSDTWFKKEIEKKKGALSKFTVDSHKNGALMSRDYVTQDGQINWELSGEWYEDPGKQPKPEGGAGTTGGAVREFKAADASQMGKQIERLFGGFYNPQTGQLSGLDPEKTRMVQSIQEEAERIYVSDPGVTHGVAVTRAARALGVNIKDYRNAAATDPLGLLNQ